MRRIAILLVSVVVAAFAANALVRPSHLPAAERGRRLAERTGCFGCHGPGGTRGANNSGRLDKTVPNFEDDLMMYADSPAEIREWIHDGVSRKKAGSVSWRADRDRGALRMPAFKNRLGEREIDDLVAFVVATSGSPEPEPEDTLAALGLQRADDLGCVGCHGPGGRLARTNPGSWKGYIPSWDGADFPELVRDSTEFREWVERGVSRRFKSNPAASFFLHRATVHMPAFQKHLEPGDVSALWAYISWRRAQPSH
jgi:mono/diheme cytochrome c family protein